MRRILLLLLLLYCAAGQVRAAEDMQQALQRQQDALGIDEAAQALPDEAAKLYDGFDTPLTADFTDGVKSILSGSLSDSGTGLRAALRAAGMLLAVALLCGILSAASAPVPERVVQISGVLAVTLLCATDLNTLIGLGQTTMEELSAFSNVLFPVLAGATVASGASSSGSALYIGTVFFANLLTNLLRAVFLPLTYACLACACAELVSGNEGLGQLRKLLQWVVSIGLKVILVCFSGYLAITGVVSGSADSAAVKAAKLALSSVVPVVGSIIADASETVLVSAGLIRNAAGVIGLLGVLAICLTPFLRLGMQYLALKMTAAVGGGVGGKAVAAMIEAAASCMGMILGMVGSVALLNLIACVCFMKAVSLA